MLLFEPVPVPQTLPPPVPLIVLLELVPVLQIVPPPLPLIVLLEPVPVPLMVVSAVVGSGAPMTFAPDGGTFTEVVIGT